MNANNSSWDQSFSCEFINPESIRATLWFHALIYLLYSTIFVVALAGNGLVCYVVCTSPRMKTVTNFFLVNLALGDILIALFCIPTSFTSSLILGYWPFGSALCPSVNYLQAVSVLVSAYTLVAISIDRYIAIMWPLRPRTSKRQAKLLILVVWALAFIISCPIAVVSKLDQPTDNYVNCERYFCREVWEPEEQRYYYSIALMVLQYVLPIMVLLFTYTSIAIMVWRKRPPGEAENDRDQRRARSKRKIVKMMMTVVVVFTLCWLPYNILILMLDYNVQVGKWLGLPYVWMALHWLSMSHCCYNPVIYCWMDARFRAGFISAFNRMPVIRRMIPSTQHNYNSSMTGIPLSGFDGSVLRRRNTCTTYVSVRQRTNGGHVPPQIHETTYPLAPHESSAPFGGTDIDIREHPNSTTTLI